ncbi:MAG: rod shape-determining protein MreC [Pseudomonadota bacterium]
MRLFSKSSSLHLKFTFLLILSISLMLLDYNHLYVAGLRKTLVIFMSPIRYIVNWPFLLINQVEKTFAEKQVLSDKNAQLQARLLIVTARLQKFKALEKENKQLRALLETMPATALKVKVAELMAVALTPIAKQVLVNKGTKQGTYIAQPVLDANGIFGQIIQMTPSISRVMLITDRNSSIPVQDERNGLRGVAMGDGNNSLILIDIPTTADVRIGDDFVTSGLAGHFPAGFPVGKVKSMTSITGQGLNKVELMPFAQLNSSRLVLLIWPQNYKTILSQNKVLSEFAHPSIKKLNKEAKHSTKVKQNAS